MYYSCLFSHHEEYMIIKPHLYIKGHRVFIKNYGLFFCLIIAFIFFFRKTRLNSLPAAITCVITYRIVSVPWISSSGLDITVSSTKWSRACGDTRHMPPELASCQYWCYYSDELLNLPLYFDKSSADSLFSTYHLQRLIMLSLKRLWITYCRLYIY